MFVEKVSPPPVFDPVKIVLETQEEVDKVFAMLNYSPIVNALQLGNWYQKLQSYRTENYRNYHDHLAQRVGH